MVKEIKSVGNWFKTKKKHNLENLYDLMTEEFNYDRMNLERANIQVEQHKTYLAEVLRENAVLTKQNEKIFAYMEKIVKLVEEVVNDNKTKKLEIKKLNDTVKELKSDRYKVVKVRPSNKTKAEVMKIKSAARTSKIMKEMTK